MKRFVNGASWRRGRGRGEEAAADDACVSRGVALTCQPSSHNAHGNSARRPSLEDDSLAPWGPGLGPGPLQPAPRNTPSRNASGARMSLHCVSQLDHAARASIHSRAHCGGTVYLLMSREMQLGRRATPADLVARRAEAPRTKHLDGARGGPRLRTCLAPLTSAAPSAPMPRSHSNTRKTRDKTNDDGAADSTFPIFLLFFFPQARLQHPSADLVDHFPARLIVCPIWLFRDVVQGRRGVGDV